MVLDRRFLPGWMPGRLSSGTRLPARRCVCIERVQGGRCGELHGVGLGLGCSGVFVEGRGIVLKCLVYVAAVGRGAVTALVRCEFEQICPPARALHVCIYMSVFGFVLLACSLLHECNASFVIGHNE